MISATALARDNETLCNNIHLKASVEPDFSKNEIRWLCGDSGNPAYAVIPLYQASIHMRAFLQQRGYTNPTLVIENGVLNVEPGEPTRVATINVVSDDFQLKSIVQRYRNDVLTPKLLNRIESAVQRRLLETGYPCAVVKSQAVDGNVTVTPTPGARRNFGQLEIDPVEGLRPEAFLRFQPFKPDELYDQSKIELYDRRLTRQNVVQGTYFQNTCEIPNTEFSIHQSFLIGPPRTIKFGVGVNTEAGPLLQAVWRHDRFRDMASHISASINLSLVEQTFLSESDLYVSPEYPRMALSPKWRVSRMTSKNTAEISSSLELLGSIVEDSWGTRFDLAAGPGFVSNWFETGAQKQLHQESSVALLLRTQARSHTYEIFDFHPQRGYAAALNLEYRDPRLGFSNTLLKTQAQFHKLFFLGEFLKGNVVIGTRIIHSNTWSDIRDPAYIAPSLKSYLGGYDNLRGFAPPSPRNRGLRALSTLSGSIEVRGPGIFASKWEPYVFVDLGRAGQHSMELDDPLYSAYGLGLRWLSPIGMVQGYVAKPDPGKIYFFAALGGEF